MGEKPGAPQLRRRAGLPFAAHKTVDGKQTDLILALQGNPEHFFLNRARKTREETPACGSIASSRGGIHVQEPYRDCRCARRRVGRIADGRPRRSRRLGQRTDEVQSSEAYPSSDVVNLASSARHWHLGILCEQPAQAVSELLLQSNGIPPRSRWGVAARAQLGV